MFAVRHAVTSPRNVAFVMALLASSCTDDAPHLTEADTYAPLHQAARAMKSGVDTLHPSLPSTLLSKTMKRHSRKMVTPCTSSATAGSEARRRRRRSACRT